MAFTQEEKERAVKLVVTDGHTLQFAAEVTKCSQASIVVWIKNYRNRMESLGAISKQEAERITSNYLKKPKKEPKKFPSKEEGKRIENERKEVAIDMHKQGIPISEIASRLFMPSHVVTSWINEYEDRLRVEGIVFYEPTEEDVKKEYEIPPEPKKFTEQDLIDQVKAQLLEEFKANADKFKHEITANDIFNHINEYIDDKFNKIKVKRTSIKVDIVSINDISARLREIEEFVKQMKSAFKFAEE